MSLGNGTYSLYFVLCIRRATWVMVLFVLAARSKERAGDLAGGGEKEVAARVL